MTTLLLFTLDLSGVFPLHNIDAGTYGLAVNVGFALLGWWIEGCRRRGGVCSSGCTVHTGCGNLQLLRPRAAARRATASRAVGRAAAAITPIVSPGSMTPSGEGAITPPGGLTPPGLTHPGGTLTPPGASTPSSASSAGSSSNSLSLSIRPPLSPSSGVHPHTLALAGLREPIQYPWFCALTLLVLACGCPFYRSAGVQVTSSTHPLPP